LPCMSLLPLIFIVSIGLLTTSVIAIQFDASYSISRLLGRENPIPPSNVTDFFNGTWAVNDTQNVENVLGFTRDNGGFILQLSMSDTESDVAKLVEGEITLRNGYFSTDPNEKYDVEGVYFSKVGTLMLIANPVNHAVVHDFTFDIDSNTSLTDLALREKFLYVEKMSFKNTTNSANTIKDCYWKMYLHYHDDPPQPDIRLRDNGDFTVDDPFLEMDGIFVSPNCGIVLNVSAKSVLMEVYYYKSIRYGFFVIITSAILVYSLIQQMKNTKTQTAAAKISLLTIGQQAILDSYLCLIHLTAGIIADKVFNVFATIAFFKFVTFAIFEMRFLLIIWRAQRPQAFTGWNSVRRDLSMIYARFYGFFLLGFFLFYYMNVLFNVFLFVMCSFWVPQIFRNAVKDTTHSLQPAYVITVSITRSFVLLYFYGCPSNFVHAEANLWLCVFFGSFMFLQAAVLLLQDQFGARFFIPSKFLPVKYNYFRSTSESQPCSICHQEIEPHRQAYMITPCDHLYHEECLSTWLNYKMECPICRSTLPAVEVSYRRQRTNNV